MNDLERYINQLIRLKRGGTKQGLAPHKPLLLLAIIDSIEKENLIENRILVDDKLYRLFAIYWRLLAEGNTGMVLMPLHHLKNDRLWKLIDYKGKQIHEKITSKAKLAKHVAFGQLEEGLFQLLKEQDYRDFFRIVLLDTYFPATKEAYNYTNQLPDYIQDIEFSLLKEAPSKYMTSTRKITGFVRDWKFRHHIMNIYDDTCCISKLQMKPSYALIEACHIIPHATSGDQRIQNGIALSVHLHRAFDAGIISIGEKYEVLVKGENTFIEYGNSPFNIRQFKKQQILLPIDERFYPAQEYLAAHRDTNGF